MLISFTIPKKFNFSGGAGYTRVTFPEIIVLKKNANIKLLDDDEGQPLATATGNMPLGRYDHLWEKKQQINKHP